MHHIKLATTVRICGRRQRMEKKKLIKKKFETMQKQKRIKVTSPLLYYACLWMNHFKINLQSGWLKCAWIRIHWIVFQFTIILFSNSKTLSFIVRTQKNCFNWKKRKGKWRMKIKNDSKWKWQWGKLFPFRLFSPPTQTRRTRKWERKRDGKISIIEWQCCFLTLFFFLRHCYRRTENWKKVIKKIKAYKTLRFN